MRISSQLRLFVSVMVVAFTCAAAGATTITEYFNDYGTSGANVSGLGSAGGGWAGAWTGTVTAAYPQYLPGSQLTYASANYSNAANASGSDDGLAVYGTSGNAGAGAYRQFSTGLTGTIWISALVHYSNSAPDALLILDATSGASNYIAIRNQSASAQAEIKTSNTPDVDEFGPSIDDNIYTANTTYLMLARIQMNVSGGNDQIDYWLFDENAGTATIPSLPATAAALPATPSFSKTGDFFGATFDAIGLSFNKTGTQFDAIRISNEANGYDQVRGIVPEPATLSLLALGGLMLAVRVPARR